MRKPRGVLMVPYVEDYPDEALHALAQMSAGGWRVNVEHVGPDKGTRYHDLVTETWEMCANINRDLMIVEGDTIAHDTVLQQFDECPHNYCVFTYWIGASYGFGLGCVRFRSKMIKAHPDLVRAAGERTKEDGLPARFWGRVDTRILGEARERGLLQCQSSAGEAWPCVHEPPVRHLHNYAMPEPIGQNEHAAGRDFVNKLGG